MGELVLTTYGWVPETPRGFVRDIRVRWALEEAGLRYRVASTPFRDRGAEHFAHHPFGQTPWLTDGDFTIFESGAILLYLAERSETLMPSDPRGRSEVQQWVFAALNSVEMVSVCWSVFMFSGFNDDSPGWKFLNGFMEARLRQMEAVLAAHEWLTGRFSIADILMADVLRLVDRFGRLTAYPACREYVACATARPAFIKAHAEQKAHFGGVG